MLENYSNPRTNRVELSKLYTRRKTDVQFHGCFHSCLYSTDRRPFSRTSCVGRLDRERERTRDRERTYGPPTLTFPNDCVTRVYRLPMRFRPAPRAQGSASLCLVTVTCARSHVSVTLFRNISIVSFPFFFSIFFYFFYFFHFWREELVRVTSRARMSRTRHRSMRFN